jgi:hypothetical protein
MLERADTAEAIGLNRRASALLDQLFRGPAHQPLAQGTFLFEHPRFGPLAIFIVLTVCTEDAAHCYYEAVFNYPVRPADVLAQLSRAPQRSRSG